MAALGLIGRCDSGGLGNLTWEVARHLHPHAVLAVQMDTLARGYEDAARYDDLAPHVRRCAYPPTDDDVRWLLGNCDTLYTAEVPYHSALFTLAREAGVHTVLHAMPELFRPEYALADEVWAPTTWRLDLLPADARVVPVPVATDRPRFHVKRAEGRLVALHLPAPAMLDRNGSDLVTQAARHPDLDARVEVRMAQPVRDYWQHYTDDVDVLLLPRRYGGLCLPAQEAAAFGIPSLMLDRDPEREWAGVHTVPVTHEVPALMAGGRVQVAHARVEDVVGALNALARQPRLLAALRAGAAWRGAALGWDTAGGSWGLGGGHGHLPPQGRAV